MRSTTRHQLKEDQFAASTLEKISWAVEHRITLLYGAIVVAVIAAVLIGGYFYMQNQQQQAALQMAAAMRVYQAPLRPAGSPAVDGEQSFTSAKERAEAARQKFQEIADKYRYTSSGHLARYFAGIALMQAGEYSAAEGQLKQAAGVRDKDLAALAKMALASVYRNSNRDQQATQIYRELMDRPTNTVAKTTAQLALAEVYEAKNDQNEARKIYEDIKKENPSSVAANVASVRLSDLK